MSHSQLCGHKHTGLCSDLSFPISGGSRLYLGGCRLELGKSGVERALWGRAGSVLLWGTLTVTFTSQNLLWLVQPQASPLPSLPPPQGLSPTLPVL